VSIVVTVVPASTTTLLAERWSDTEARWRFFGRPRPRVLAMQDGARAFFNAGDGTYLSGAWTRVDWPATGGLGVEAPVRAQIDSAQWQSLQVRLATGLDTVAASAWADRDAAGVAFDNGSLAACSIGLPTGEGASRRDSLTVGVGAESRALPGHGANDGRWHRIRVQVLPDGRCGVALDGRPLWISEAHLSTDARYRVITGGNSAWTEILVGPLDVWQGVRTDVDWTLLDGTATTATTPPAAPVSPPMAGQASAAPPPTRSASRPAPSPVPSPRAPAQH
jgi:hypothetical protein